MAFNHPQMFDVRDYGTIGTLDDAPAYNAAIQAMGPHGGSLPIIGSRPNIETSIILDRPVNLWGLGRTDSSGRFGPTTIQTSSPTATPIIVRSAACTLEKFGAVNTSTNVTAGAGVLVDIYELRSPESGWDVIDGVPQYAGASFDLDKVTLYGYYDALHVQNGTEYTVNNFHFEAYRRYGFFAEHQRLEDGGDQSVVGGQFISTRYDGSTGMFIKSGGGPKIVNCKWNGRNGLQNHKICLDVDVQNSVDLVVTNCSMENAALNVIKIRPSPLMCGIVIEGNQINPGRCAGPMIDVEGVQNVQIGSNTITGYNSPTNIAVSVRNCYDGGYVAKQTLRGFAGNNYAGIATDRRLGMQRINSPTVDFDGVAGGADF